MKLLHKLSIDSEHYILVWDNGSHSNYNRFFAVVHKNNMKDYLIGSTIKEVSRKEYKEIGLEYKLHYYKQLSIV